MKFGTAFKRGTNFIKLVVVARNLSISISNDQRIRAQHYLIELLGESKDYLPRSASS